MTGTPTYWKDDEKFPGNRLPYADKLVMLMMSDEATRIAALRSGQIDITGETGVSRIKLIANAVQLQKNVPGIQLFPIAIKSETSLAMRIDKPPLSDIRVRHALQMAINLEEARDNYFSGFGEWQPTGVIGPAVTGYNNPFDTWPAELKKFWSYNPAGAERLLDEAGYPRGADGVRFQTSIMTNGDRADVGYMELVAGYWKEIGVEAEIEALDNATNTGRRNALDYDGFVDFWTVGSDFVALNQTLGTFSAASNYRPAPSAIRCSRPGGRSYRLCQLMTQRSPDGWRRRSTCTSSSSTPTSLVRGLQRSTLRSRGSSVTMARWRSATVPGTGPTRACGSIVSSRMS